MGVTLCISLRWVVDVIENKIEISFTNKQTATIQRDINIYHTIIVISVRHSPVDRKGVLLTKSHRTHNVLRRIMWVRGTSRCLGKSVTGIRMRNVEVHDDAKTTSSNDQIVEYLNSTERKDLDIYRMT